MRKLRQIPGGSLLVIHGVVQNDTYFLGHRMAMPGSTYAEARRHVVVKISDRYVCHVQIPC